MKRPIGAGFRVRLSVCGPRQSGCCGLSAADARPVAGTGISERMRQVRHADRSGPPSEPLHSMKVERLFCHLGSTCKGAEPHAPRSNSTLRRLRENAYSRSVAGMRSAWHAPGPARHQRPSPRPWVSFKHASIGSRAIHRLRGPWSREALLHRNPIKPGVCPDSCAKPFFLSTKRDPTSGGLCHVKQSAKHLDPIGDYGGLSNRPSVARAAGEGPPVPSARSKT